MHGVSNIEYCAQLFQIRKVIFAPELYHFPDLMK